MITPQHILAAIANEFRIMKHLAGKVTTENKAYRFTSWQRSTEELLCYIISSFPIQVKLMVLWKRDEEVYTDYAKQFAWFTFDQFAWELEKAYTMIEQEILSLTDTQRQEHITIRGMEGPRTKFLNDYTLVFLGAYKMQLFLQLKASGLSTLGTYNLWAGMDATQ